MRLLTARKVKEWRVLQQKQSLLGKATQQGPRVRSEAKETKLSTSVILRGMLGQSSCKMQTNMNGFYCCLMLFTLQDFANTWPWPNSSTKSILIADPCIFSCLVCRWHSSWSPPANSWWKTLSRHCLPNSFQGIYAVRPPNDQASSVLSSWFGCRTRLTPRLAEDRLVHLPTPSQASRASRGWMRGISWPEVLKTGLKYRTQDLRLNTVGGDPTSQLANSTCRTPFAKLTQEEPKSKERDNMRQLHNCATCFRDVFMLMQSLDKTKQSVPSLVVVICGQTEVNLVTQANGINSDLDIINKPLAIALSRLGRTHNGKRACIKTTAVSGQKNIRPGDSWERPSVLTSGVLVTVIRTKRNGLKFGFDFAHQCSWGGVSNQFENVQVWVAWKRSIAK